MSVITAIGAAGVPGGSIPLLVGVLTMFGVPGEGHRDRARRRSDPRHVADDGQRHADLTAATWVARSEGVWTPDQVPERVAA